jgi:Protein kinase domain
MSDASESSEESPEEYTTGGYHPVKIGDTYEKHVILRKLGYGHFSTVWLAKHGNSVKALKIMKSAPRYTETANDEIMLLQKVDEASQSEYRNYVVKLFDTFRINGPHGSHVAMTFEVFGPNLLTLIKKYEYDGVPIQTSKMITKQILMGMQYLHEDCGIIHTDLKPENILTVVDVDEELKRLGLYDTVYHNKEIPGLIKIKVETLDEEFKRLEMSLTEKKLTQNQKKKLKMKLKKLKAKMESGGGNTANEKDGNAANDNAANEKDGNAANEQQEQDVKDNMDQINQKDQDGDSNMQANTPSEPHIRENRPPSPPSKGLGKRRDKDTGSRAVSREPSDDPIL